MIARFMRLRRRRRNDNGNGLRLLIAGALALILPIVLVAALGLGTVAGVYAYYVKDLPAPEEMGRQARESFKTTRIYDRTGKTVLYEIFDPRGGNRTVVHLEQIPLHLRQATIAIEDRSFYENPGVDPKRLAAAVWSNFAMYVEDRFGMDLPYRGIPSQGGSSITQQLVKNVLIPPEERYRRLPSRKIKEVILSLEISRLYSKDQILEWYLNTICYGNLAYGVEAAAQAYFGKHVQDLSLAECAMLAGLPQAPAANSPLENPERAKRRQHLVLDAMFRQGYIALDELLAAKAETLHYTSKKFEIKAPHFVMHVRRLLEERYGPEMLYRGGLRVYTTLDLDMQERAEEIARRHIKKLQQEEHNVSNAALVSIRPATGEILAMLGSIDYFDKDIDGQVNIALSERQPGSSFKPFTYVTAFAQGYTPATMLMDVRTSFPDDPHPPYVPENYDREYHGPQLLRHALACSYNIPAVKLLDMVGVHNVIDTAHRMGINTLTRDYYGLSLTLGGGEVTLLDMTYAYSVFANRGVMAGRAVLPDKLRPGYRELNPVAILRVEDAEGHVVEEYTSPQTNEVLSPQLAYLVTHVLADREARIAGIGWNNPLELSRPAAAKTGSTTDWRDAWTIGYTPQLVTGVWVGNSDNEPMKDVPGSRGAGPIWHDFMEGGLANLPVEDFIRPDGLEEVEVCATSGLLPTDHCPHKVKEIFIKGTAPTTLCNVHQIFRVNRETGKLATVHTPLELVEERVYEIYPPEAADWVRENNIPQPPTQYDTAYGPSPVSGDVAITSPESHAYLREVVPIVGNVKADLGVYRLQYGEGLDPSSWTQIGGDHHNWVDNGTLEYWDVSQLNGLYTLQLSVVGKDGNQRQAAIQVTVDNISPAVEIIHPEPDAIYVMEDDEWINIQAEAKDNFSMDKVEFYLDDNPIGYSTVASYNKKWIIEMAGEGPEEHTIYVVACDSAGNRTESERIRINVIHRREE